MLSDIEIAQQAEMQKIREVAAGLSIEEDDLEYYGHYKAKLSESLFQKLEDKPNGKLILVTAINPTPAGEGKTTVSVGLADALRCIGKKSVVALREPSLGPVFGIKGGAAGGGHGLLPGRKKAPGAVGSPGSASGGAVHAADLHASGLGTIRQSAGMREDLLSRPSVVQYGRCIQENAASPGLPAGGHEEELRYERHRHRRGAG